MMTQKVICKIIEGDSKLFTAGRIYDVEMIHGGVGIIRDDFNIMHYMMIGHTKNWFGATLVFETYNENTEKRGPIMKLVQKLAAALTLSSAMLMTGCASIVSDSQYPVAVSSTPDHAEFTVRNEDGITVAGGMTPSTVMLKSGAGFFNGETYIVEFRKDGYSSRIVTLDSSMDGWYFGNLLFGGLVGLFVVDPLTGAMWKLPTTAYADLAPNTTAAK